MRVLFISNFTAGRCGVMEFGKLMYAAMRAYTPVQLDTWDGTYPAAKEHGYLPYNAADYDLIHLNWDPAAINHYLPQHFPPNVPLSVWLHDVPPNSTCPVQEIASLLIAYEPSPLYPKQIKVLDHAIPPYQGQWFESYHKPQPIPSRFIVGLSGVRADPGAGIVQRVVARLDAEAAVDGGRRWSMNEPAWWTAGGPWLSLEEEINRLAASTINVCWYRTSGRGKSMAAMMMAATRRPLVLSGSTMFSVFDRYPDEVYRAAHESSAEEELEFYLRRLAVQLGNQPVRIPTRIVQEQSWKVRAQQVEELWRKTAATPVTPSC